MKIGPKLTCIRWANSDSLQQGEYLCIGLCDDETPEAYSRYSKANE